MRMMTTMTIRDKARLRLAVQVIAQTKNYLSFSTDDLQLFGLQPDLNVVYSWPLVQEEAAAILMDFFEKLV